MFPYRTTIRTTADKMDPKTTYFCHTDASTPTEEGVLFATVVEPNLSLMVSRGDNEDFSRVLYRGNKGEPITLDTAWDLQGIWKTRRSEYVIEGSENVQFTLRTGEKITVLDRPFALIAHEDGTVEWECERKVDGGSFEKESGQHFPGEKGNKIPSEKDNEMDGDTVTVESNATQT